MKQNILLGLSTVILGLGLIGCSHGTKNIAFETRSDYEARVTSEIESMEARLTSVDSESEAAGIAGNRVLDAKRDLRQLKVTSDDNWEAQKGRLEASLGAARNDLEKFPAE